MYCEEKLKLLDLFEKEESWCRDAEARDEGGQPVRFDDPRASAWDLTGALCRLFGWRRACVLFPQLDRHLLGKREARWRVRDLGIEAMTALQDLNDQRGTTYSWLIGRLRDMPVYDRHKSAEGYAETPDLELHPAEQASH